MQFSYEISEEDYVRGRKLARRSSRGVLIKAIVLWLVVIAALMMLSGAIQKNTIR